MWKLINFTNSQKIWSNLGIGISAICHMYHWICRNPTGIVSQEDIFILSINSWSLLPWTHLSLYNCDICVWLLCGQTSPTHHCHHHWPHSPGHLLRLLWPLVLVPPEAKTGGDHHLPPATRSRSSLCHLVHIQFLPPSNFENWRLLRVSSYNFHCFWNMDLRILSW